MSSLKEYWCTGMKKTWRHDHGCFVWVRTLYIQLWEKGRDILLEGSLDERKRWYLGRKLQMSQHLSSPPHLESVLYSPHSAFAHTHMPFHPCTSSKKVLTSKKDKRKKRISQMLSQWCMHLCTYSMCVHDVIQMQHMSVKCSSFITAVICFVQPRSILRQSPDSTDNLNSFCTRHSLSLSVSLTPTHTRTAWNERRDFECPLSLSKSLIRAEGFIVLFWVLFFLACFPVRGV